MPHHLADLAVSDSGFVFNPRTGHVFTVNPTGRAILGLLKEGFDLDQITEQLRATHEVDHGTDVARDVAEFLSILDDYGLVSRDEERP